LTLNTAFRLIPAQAPCRIFAGARAERAGTDCLRKGQEQMKVFLAWIIAAAAVLSGCASAKIELGGQSGAPDGEAAVFGQILVVRDQQPVRWGFLEPDFVLTILGPSSRSYPVVLRGEGSFAWHLPPGDYTAAAFSWGGLSGRIFADFSVEPGDACLYVGTLRIDFSGMSYSASIEDREETAFAAFTTQHASAGLTGKRLFHLEVQR
jgi:hypothetical protein